MYIFHKVCDIHCSSKSIDTRGRLNYHKMVLDKITNLKMFYKTFAFAVGLDPALIQTLCIYPVNVYS